MTCKKTALASNDGDTSSDCIFCSVASLELCCKNRRIWPYPTADLCATVRRHIAGTECYNRVNTMVLPTCNTSQVSSLPFHLPIARLILWPIHSLRHSLVTMKRTSTSKRFQAIFTMFSLTTKSGCLHTCFCSVLAMRLN